MNDETTILMVVTATLAVLVFTTVQVKAHKARRRGSDWAMYKPASMDHEPPA